MHQQLIRAIFATMTLLFSLSACTHPQYQTRPDTSTDHTQLTADTVITPDGFALPMKTWASNTTATAVVLAVHGFNDYSNAFDATAQSFSNHTITTYAFDQRGFGATAQHGLWPGPNIMQADLITVVSLLCKKHTNVPIYLLGESMGGAVILAALQQLEHTCIQGLILSSPAVWGWQTMPWWQTAPLRLLAHVAPKTTLTGKGLDIHPSDNQAMLNALHDDPLIIKATRIDAIYGLTDLMESAFSNSTALTLPALILYGEHDEIIPAKPFCQMTNDLPDQKHSQWRMLLYPDGFHMLSRDLQGSVVIEDMTVWLHDQSAQIPSGHEISINSSRLSALDGCN